MGAWGAGSFENDAALDFIAGVASLEDLRRTFDELAQNGPGPDVDLASETIGAADVIACCLDRPPADLPDGIADRLSGFDRPDGGLIKAAQQAVRTVRSSSELADLWEETGGQDWADAIEDLLTRLDLSKPYTAQTKDVDAPVATGEVSSQCHLCHGHVTEADEVALTVEEDFDGIWSSFTLYAHRDCLMDRYEPPHFNRDGTPSAELLAQFRRTLDLPD